MSTIAPARTSPEIKLENFEAGIRADGVSGVLRSEIVGSRVDVVLKLDAGMFPAEFTLSIPVEHSKDIADALRPSTAGTLSAVEESVSKLAGIPGAVRSMSVPTSA